MACLRTPVRPASAVDGSASERRTSRWLGDDELRGKGGGGGWEGGPVQNGRTLRRSPIQHRLRGRVPSPFLPQQIGQNPALPALQEGQRY